MPKTKHIKKKKVENVNDREEVIKIYIESTKHLIGEDKKSLKIPDNSVDQSGIFNQAMRSIDWGGKEYILDELDVSIGEHSYELMERYISGFLNQILRIVETSPENSTEKEFISSKYVLIYEIFLRFAAVLLSDEHHKKPNDSQGTTCDNYSQRANIKLLDAMEKFGSNLLASNTLKLDRRYKQFLNSNHAKWISCIRSAIKIIQLINQPVRSFTSANKYFKDAQNCAKAHIISILYHSEGNTINKGRLNENWIDDTYLNLLNNTNKDKDIILQKSASSTKNQIALNNVERQLITRIQVENPEKSELLLNLFIYLKKTQVAEKLFGAIDGLVGIGNWLIFLSDSFKMDALASYIEMHGKESLDIFKPSNEKMHGIHNYDILISSNLPSGISLVSSACIIGKEMRMLSLTSSHDLIMDYAFEKLEQISGYQNVLEIEVINHTKLNLFGNDIAPRLQEKPSIIPERICAIEHNTEKIPLSSNPINYHEIINESVTVEMTLPRFNEIIMEYEKGSYNTSNETKELITECQTIKSDAVRAGLILNYLKSGKKGRLHEILVSKFFDGNLFNKPTIPQVPPFKPNINRLVPINKEPLLISSQNQMIETDKNEISDERPKKSMQINQEPVINKENHSPKISIKSRQSKSNPSQLSSGPTELFDLSYDSANFCAEIYLKKSKKVIDGWECILTSMQKEISKDKIEYAGAAYINKEKNIVIIVHRGTQNSRAKNLHENYNITNGKLPDNYEKAKEFSKKVRTVCTNYWIIETGHSVGGFYASLNACQYKGDAITFDSPGIKQYDKIFNLNHAKNIINFFSAPHFINTVSTHIGKKYRLYVSHVNEKEISENEKDGFIKYILNIIGTPLNLVKNILASMTSFELSYISRQHSMENIFKTFDKKFKNPCLCGELDKWPTHDDYIRSNFWKYLNYSYKFNAFWPNIAFNITTYLFGSSENDFINNNRRLEQSLMDIFGENKYTYPKLIHPSRLIKNVAKNNEEKRLFIINTEQRFTFFYHPDHTKYSDFAKSLSSKINDDISDDDKLYDQIHIDSEIIENSPHFP